MRVEIGSLWVGIQLRSCRRFALDSPLSPPCTKEKAKTRLQELGPVRVQGVLAIFFFVCHFRAVSCLSNPFLTHLEVGCSRTGVKTFRPEGARGCSQVCTGHVPTTPTSAPPPGCPTHFWSAVLAHQHRPPIHPNSSLFRAVSLQLDLGQMFQVPSVSPRPWHGRKGPQPWTGCSCQRYHV